MWGLVACVLQWLRARTGDGVSLEMDTQGLLVLILHFQGLIDTCSNPESSPHGSHSPQPLALHRTGACSIHGLLLVVTLVTRQRVAVTQGVAELLHHYRNSLHNSRPTPQTPVN